MEHLELWCIEKGRLKGHACTGSEEGIVLIIGIETVYKTLEADCNQR